MTAFEEYTEEYGFHFSRKLYEFAVTLMWDRNGNRVQPTTKEAVSEFLRAHGVSLKNDRGYDAAYVYSMAMADYYGSSLPDDARLALFIADYLDDRDGSKTKAFDHFVVDCRAKGEPVFWDEMR